MYVSIVTGPRLLRVLGRDVTLKKTCGSTADCSFDELCGRVSVLSWFVLPFTSVIVKQNRCSVFSSIYHLSQRVSNKHKKKTTYMISDNKSRFTMQEGSTDCMYAHTRTHTVHSPTQDPLATNQNCSNSKHFSYLFIILFLAAFVYLLSKPMLSNWIIFPQSQSYFLLNVKKQSIEDLVNSWAGCASNKAVWYSSVCKVFCLTDSGEILQASKLQGFLFHLTIYCLLACPL